MQKRLFGIVGGLVMSGMLDGATAHAQDASLTVSLRAAGSGTFNKTSSISTQVNLFATSSLAAKYNSGTNLYAPTGMAATGTAFNQQIPNLYSAAAEPGNSYQIRLSWTDNADKQLTFGPFALTSGVNTLGAGGRGTTTPIDITNDPPPAATNLNCYADVPDRSTQLYLYWKGVLLANVKDLSRTELHVSQTVGFSPSVATLVATPPYGTDYRKLTNLKPATDYYYCVRIIDNYGAYTDACRTTACTTEMGTPSDGGIADGSTAGQDGGGITTDGGEVNSDGGNDDLTSGTPDSGTGQPPGGSVPVGCGCSLTTISLAPSVLAFLPALALLLRRRRRA